MLGSRIVSFVEKPLLRRRSVFTKRCLQREPHVPLHALSQLRHGDLLFASEPLDMASPLDAAIQELGHATLQWLKQRGAQGLSKNTAEHVAMVVADSSGHAVSVVEAVRVVGVRVLPLSCFFEEFMLGTEFFHGQVQDVSRDQARQAVWYAMQRVGASYASDFSSPCSWSNPWEQRFYCSSLVDYAYRDALGQDLVFTEEPFPLTFVPMHFWKEYYRKQGEVVPSGHGSNPTLLLQSPKVQRSLIDLDQPEHDRGLETHEMF